MNYNQKVEEKVFKKYISHGINENIVVTNVEKVSGEKDTTIWNAFDITFSNGESELKTRIFEFKYRAGGTNAKGVIEDEATQESKYLKRIKHIFSKVIGDPDKYDTLVSKATSFDSFITILKSMITNSKPFRLMCIDNKKGYATVPGWDSGFIESMDINPSKLQFNEARYGKVNVSKEVEVIATTNSELPF